MEKEIKMRICSCCGEEKSLEENFFKNKNSREGHLTECKKCFKQKSSKYADTRRESAKIKRREQGIKPKTTFSSEEERKHAHNKAVQKWNSRNKFRMDEYQKEYRESNKEYRLQWIKSWRKRNAHKVLATAAKRRAMERQSTPLWADWDKIADVYFMSKMMTELTDIPHVVDHYFPINGKTVCGLHVAENLQVISKQENLLKGSKHPDDFYS